MKSGLEVFDFSEEDELPEIAAGKFLAKFRNPSDGNRNSSLLKYEFLECVAQGSGAPRKEMKSLPCVDVDVIDSDCASDVPVACTPLRLVIEDTGGRDEDCGLRVQCPSFSPGHATGSNVEVDVSEPRNSMAGPQPRALPSCDEAPSLLTGKCNAALADSLPTNEPADVTIEADYRMDVIPPSSPTLDIAKDAVTLTCQPSIPCFVGSERDNVHVTVDYVVTRDAYYTGCCVTFSSHGVKINRSNMDEFEALSFEKSIEDIIRIESQHLQRFDTVMVKLQVLSDNRGQSCQENEVSGIEELEFAVVDPNWSRKWEEITTRNVKYSALSNVVHDIDAAIDEGTNRLRQRPHYPTFDEAFEDVIYPKGDSDAVSISKRDVDLLQPEIFINDTVIDFYINYLKNHIPKEERQRFHFFNSFFFRKLADLDKDPSSASDGRAAFLRVRKWTRKVDLFGKDYIFIPVNFSFHWSLLIFCHLGQLVSSSELESQRIPCVLHMDSIKGTHAGLKDLVQSYLWEEWKERHAGTPEDLSKMFLNLRFVPLELPQQENSFDCGLFLLHYLELFLVDAPSNFSPFNINEATKFLTADWFPPVEASLKRTLIQRLISELLEKRSLEVSSSDCSDGEKGGGFEFVGENYSAATCQGGLSNSISGPGIEMTLLEASSDRNQHCANDPSLVLRDLFEPGVAAGSLLTHCSSFGRPDSYYDHNSAMSQVEDDDTDNRDQLMFLAPGETAFQQMVNMAPQINGDCYTFGGFRADASWKLRTSVEEEDDKTSSKASDCASDDSDVGIIENYQIKDTNHYQNIVEQVSQGIENDGCLTEGFASASEEMPESVVEQDAKNMQLSEGTDNDGSLTEGFTSASEEMPESVAEKCSEEATKMQISQEIGNVGCLTEGVASASKEMYERVVDECNEDNKKTHVSDENGHLVDGPENPSVTLDEWPFAGENRSDEDTVKTTVVPEDEKMIDDGMADLDEQVDAERRQEDEEHQQAAKRLKLTPSTEAEGCLAGSLPEDLHL